MAEAPVLHYILTSAKVTWRDNLVKQNYAVNCSDSDFQSTSQTPEAPRTAACVFLHPAQAPAVRFYTAFLNTMANKLQNHQLLWKSLL